MADGRSDARWLLLIHQLPPKPEALRLRVWRRLQKHGAVAIKNTVYVLPNDASGRETFEWTLREIESAGGQAFLCDARFIAGLDDDKIERLFRDARDADYEAIVKEARQLAGRVAGDNAERRLEARAQLAKLERRLSQVIANDVMEARGREAAVKAVGS